MPNLANLHCPCCSEKLFQNCCAPLLSGMAKARTVKQLMRSRFCAFKLGSHGQYLLDTWHPTGSASLTAENLDQPGLEWSTLTVIDAAQQGDRGTVEFKAYYSDEAGPQCHHETSDFLREQGQWRYLAGTVHPNS